ncbi:MAG: TlpA disulfide reductase family protein [Elusimicrobia bacterium]|nr:TlpA disulfide reductase family protein [Elusimicrobiota bacterium]
MDRSDAAILILLLAGALLLSLLTFERCAAPPKPLGPAPEAGIPVLLQAPAAALGSLSELRGRAVVLEFWATWCPTCRETIPHMNKMRAKFQERPVVFISVTNEPREKVERFLKDHPITGWVGIDEASGLQHALKVTGIPEVFIIDPQGQIRLKISPSFIYDTDIERALKAAPQKQAVRQ